MTIANDGSLDFSLGRFRLVSDRLVAASNGHQSNVTSSVRLKLGYLEL